MTTPITPIAMIKVLAIDDEPLALQQLATCIQQIPYFQLVGTAACAVEARGVLEHEAVDAIFIDINMPDLNGLDFVRSLLAPPLVVFTTAYSEYAVEGFRTNAVHYLLKPFSMDEFRQAAEKVRRQYELENAVSAAPGAQVSDESAQLTESDNIFLKTDYKVVRVGVRDIRYIESMGSYLRFHLVGQQRPIMALLTMKRIEERLPASIFMRIHRSYVVNLHEIIEVSRNHVILDDATSIPVGDLYRDAFVSYLNSHFIGR